MNYSRLKNRGVIKIAGEDRFSFLQGLLTQNISVEYDKGDCYYGLMLTPQGKFLYDCFIFYNDDYILLDCQKLYINQIVERLQKHKLRAKITTEDVSDVFYVVTSFDKIEEKFLIDPRSKKMGFRCCTDNYRDYNSQFINEYEIRRISLLIPDADSDLDFFKSFPLHYGMDKINAIDFEKGCYIGQEVTTRTYRRGVIRKKLVGFIISTNIAIEKGTEVLMSGNNIGATLSTQYSSKTGQTHCLCIVKKEIDINLKALKIMNMIPLDVIV